MKCFTKIVIILFCISIVQPTFPMHTIKTWFKNFKSKSLVSKYAHFFSKTKSTDYTWLNRSLYYKVMTGGGISTALILGAKIVTSDSPKHNIQQQKMNDSLVIQQLGQGRKNTSKVIELFKHDVKNNKAQNEHIPPKTNDIFRIMSYNVHFWRSPDTSSNNKKIIWDIVNELKPDVLILQEVSEKNEQNVNNKIHAKGYSYIAKHNTVKGFWFGNIIASHKRPTTTKSYSFKNQERPGQENRGYCYTAIQLPNGKTVHIYGLHLEVGQLKNFDVQKLRSEQIKELYSYAESHLKNQNVIIAGDFNEVRQNILPLGNFTDSFTALDWKHPSYTSMYGTEVDFIMLNKEFNLPLSGAYVYYSDASDHLPLIMDIKL